jgi:uncharacterized protein DUF6299
MTRCRGVGRDDAPGKGAVMRLRTVLMATMAGILFLPNSAAFAKPAGPSNDAISGATAIGALPFNTTEDTTSATTDSQDTQVNSSCGAPHTDASVWFSLAATSDQELIVDVSKSNYSAGIIVATGSPGSLTTQVCSPGSLIFQASNGTTYYILAFDDQSDGSGNGGQLVMSVDVAPPPPTVSVTVDSIGHLDHQGDAVITGTENCSAQDLQYSELDVSASQNVGRIGTIQGFGFGDLPCDGATHAWSVVVSPQSGKFAGGKAKVSADGFACNITSCSDSSVSQTVQLRR